MFLLRKSKYFANIMSIGVIGALYLFCILRMVLPIEIPQVHTIIRDPHIYTTVVDYLTVKSGLGKYSLLYILLALWILVSLILLIRFLVKQRGFRKYIDANADLANEDERSLLKTVAEEVFGKEKDISLKKTDAVNESMVIGFVHPMVLIPDIEYSRTELEMIFRHECMHIRDKDIWVKLLIELYCIIFWWNPFSYLMKVDISDTLETKCDLNVIKRFDNMDKLKYAETVAKFMSIEKDKKVPFVNARFSKARNNKEAVKRIAAILQAPPKKSAQIILNLVAVVLIVGIFIGSYTIIVQPYSEPTKSDFEILEGEKAIKDEECYLVKQEDGNYLFYYSDFPPQVISKEEVEKGFYNNYPIYEE
ncbi:MAG: M56 family metallopeptidase [Ruminococcus sp.]|nr:M56 family metallopeptidase [Ruminococcus sp.]